MAVQIRIRPDQMRDRAMQYRMEAESMHGIISKLDFLLAQLQSEWEGDSSEAFAYRYEMLKPGFEKGAELIEEIADALLSTADLVEQTDAEISNQFRG